MDLRDGKKTGAGEDMEEKKETIEEIPENEKMMSMFAMIMSRMEESREENRQMREENREMMEKNGAMMNRLEENMEKKMEKNRKMLEKKMEEGIVRFEGKVDRLVEKVGNIGRRLDSTKVELSQEMEFLKVETDKKLEQNKEVIREEVIGRINEIEKVQDDKIRRFVGRDVNDNFVKVQEAVALVDKRSEERDEAIEDRIRGIENIGVVKSIGVFQGGRIENRFDGSIRKIHSEVFVNILRNRTANINCVEEMKEYIREAFDKDVLLWFSSREREFVSYEDFEKSFLDCYWGEIKESLRNAKETVSGRNTAEKTEERERYKKIKENPLLYE
ncbi:unnamed protein product [Psylliodes chrysocephalus]|uniref:Uncharacterized protein n=1 Tax=Psylliodes chrysocephalus TaxID=3402493 RepID=A0A9P0D5Z9_9CUCU|nr:unnamed protein product [Psylliodes chrysocephala]